MKIKLSFYQPSATDIHNALMKDEKFRKTFKNFDERFFIDTDTSDFGKLLELTKNTSGFQFQSGGVEFEENETKGIRLYRPRPRKVLPESSSAYNKNRAYIEKIPLRPTTGEFKIRLIDRLLLNKISLSKDSLGSLDLYDEYIITDDIKEIFQQDQLKGIDFLPVYKINGKDAHEGFYLLYGEKTLPEATINKVFNYKIDDGLYYFKIKGPFSYDYKKIDFQSDFYRTAEPIGSEYTPCWIVSEKVKQCYEGYKLKGLWEFRPVLDTNSELYSKYIEEWDKILEKIAINPNNQLK